MVFVIRELIVIGNNLDIYNDIVKTKWYFSINYIKNIYVIILLL